MKNLLNEEINKIRLMFGYDSKRTLSENKNESISLINEQPSGLRALFATGSKGLIKTAISEIDDVIRTRGFVGGIVDTSGKALKNGDDIVNAITRGELAPANLGKVNQALFKTTKDSNLKAAIAEDIATSSSASKKFPTMTENEVFENLIYNTGHSSDDAKLIIQKYKEGGGLFRGQSATKTTPSRTERITTYEAPRRNTTPPRKERFNDYSYSYGKYGRTSGIQKARSILSTVTMVPGAIWSLIKLAGVVGIAYYIWKAFTDNKSLNYPDCLSKNIPAEDFKKMVEEGREHILNTDTGNAFIDDNGGGRFFQDRKFETENKKYKGTWKEVSNVGIVVKTDDGKEHTISCEGMTNWSEVESDEKRYIPDVSGWDGTFKECSSFPLSIGCENKDIIGKVQRCLGLPEDGKFSFELQKRLQRDNYGNILTQSVYDKIMSKCGMPEQESGFASSFI